MTDDEYQLMGYAALNAQAATFLAAVVEQAGGWIEIAANPLALARADRIRVDSHQNDSGLVVLNSIVLPRSKVRP